MEDHGRSRKVMEGHGRARKAVEGHGRPWKSCQGLSCQGFPRLSDESCQEASVGRVCGGALFFSSHIVDAQDAVDVGGGAGRDLGDARGPSCVVEGKAELPARARLVDKAIRGTQRQSEALRSTPKQSEAIGSNRKQSEALRSTQKQSEAIRSNHPVIGIEARLDCLDAHAESGQRRVLGHVTGPPEGLGLLHLPSEAIRRNEKPSEAIRRNEKPSEAIRRNEKQSAGPPEGRPGPPPPGSPRRVLICGREVCQGEGGARGCQGRGGG